LDIILEKRYIYKIENNDCGIESQYPQFRKSLFIILWTRYFSTANSIISYDLSIYEKKFHNCGA